MPPTPSGHQHVQRSRTPLAALWRVRAYLRPYRGRLLFMLTAAVAAVAAQLCIPLIAKSIIDGPIAHGQRGQLVLLGLAATGLGAATALLNFLRRWTQAGVIAGMERAMREDLYAHLQRLHPGFHDDWGSGQLLSRATTDLSAIRRFAGFGTIFFITNIVTFATVAVLLIGLDPALGLLTTAALVPVVVASTWFERRYRVLSRRAQDQQGDLATYVEEAATGINVLKALGRRDSAQRRHRALAEDVYQTQLSKARLRGTFWATLDLAPNAAIGLLLLLGGLATAHHQLSLGGLVGFITLTLQLVWPVESMGFILASGQEAATAAQRLYEILDTSPAIAGPPAAGPAAPPAPDRPPSRVPSPRRAGRPAGLRFEGVAFAFPGAPAPLLRDVWLAVEPGQTVALTGATGTGKTTLLHLVPRLADPTGGRVLLDGADVAGLPLPSLRARIGCAFEDPTLFSASVRENVSLGAPDATDDDIARALAVAQAQFVYDLPWGLQTRIGERGMSLSGGQRQRLALARAILARPSLLIMDDPLSALDVGTEEQVTTALREVLAGTTALIVAHRPSTVALADSVALLAGGEIVALGAHHELLAAEPRYRELMGGGEPAGDDGPSRGLAGETASR